MYLCSLPGPACCSCHVYDFKVFLNAFLFFSAFLPSLYVNTSSPADNFSPVSLSSSVLYLTSLFTLSLSSFLSQAPCENLRTPSTYPGNMLPHHPGQGNFEDFTCWGDPGEASECVLCNQSQPYNKNYPPRGVWGTDTKSDRGSFYIETE